MEEKNMRGEEPRYNLGDAIFIGKAVVRLIDAERDYWIAYGVNRVNRPFLRMKRKILEDFTQRPVETGTKLFGAIAEYFSAMFQYPEVKKEAALTKLYEKAKEYLRPEEALGFFK